MSHITKQITDMVDLLPEREQMLAYEVVKRLVQAWDPDYTKVTDGEAEAIDKARAEFSRRETVSHSDINWN